MKADVFTDYKGQKGYIGSKVIHWMDNTNTENKKIVESISKRGRAGTLIKVEGERGHWNAKSYIIVED